MLQTFTYSSAKLYVFSPVSWSFGELKSPPVDPPMFVTSKNFISACKEYKLYKAHIAWVSLEQNCLQFMTCIMIKLLLCHTLSYVCIVINMPQSLRFTLDKYVSRTSNKRCWLRYNKCESSYKNSFYKKSGLWKYFQLYVACSTFYIGVDKLKKWGNNR